MNDSVSANTLIVRVSSWTSEKVGLKKGLESGNNTGLKDVKSKDNYDYSNYKLTMNNEKNTQYVKKMLESNNDLKTGNLWVNLAEKYLR